MSYPVKNGQTSVVLRFKLLDSTSTVGAGLTGLSSASSGLIISTIADNESTATTYTVAGSTIETITTLGTFATPTATKCRFKEVDSTNHKGIYEFQFDNARFAVSSAKSLLISVLGATNLAQADYVLALVSDDPYVAKPTNSSLLSIDGNGRVDVIKIAGTTQTARDIGASVLLAAGQKVDVDTIKTNPVVNGGTVTFPTNATLASTTNITSATGITVSTNSDKTGYTLSAAGISAIWQDTTASDFTTASSIGKSIMNGVALGTGLTVASVSGAVGSVTAGVTVTTNNDKTGYTLSSAGITAIWQDSTAGDFTAAGSIGKSIMNGVTLGTGLTVNALTTNNDKTGYSLTAAYDPAKTASQAGDAMTLTSAYDFAKGTVAMTESYAANGAAPTPVQAIYAIHQDLMEFAISGTSYTVKKLDNLTTAFTVTLDDATNPTSAHR